MSDVLPPELPPPPPPPPPPPAPRPRLQRGTDRRLAGVCSGLAEHLGLDPLLVRLVFLILLFPGGIGLLTYVILMVLMPDPQHPGRTGWPALPSIGHEEMRRRSGLGAGVLLVVVGAVLLAANLGVLSWIPWNVVWPVALIVAGLALLVRRI